MVGRHERLKIWQKSYDLARDLMQVTERFPRPQQQGGLASEIRRASLDLIQTVMLANSTQSTAVNRDLDQEIDYLQGLLQRLENNMSKNQMAERLGISKATLYEWLKQE